MSFFSSLGNQAKSVATNPTSLLSAIANPGSAATTASMGALGFKGFDGYGDELGLGRYKADPYQVDKKAFTSTPDLDRVYTSYNQDLAAAQRRQSPSMNAAQVKGLKNVGPYNAAKSANIAQGPQNQVRQQQMSLADSLAAQAQGQGPSVAGMQLRESTDRGLKQALALAASQRGSSPLQQSRMAANAQAQIQSDAGRAAAQMRVQEQLNAQNALNSVLSGTRTQDIGLASNQAQLAQQANLANFQGGLQSALQNNQFQNQGALLNAQNQQAANQQNLAAALANQQQIDNMSQFYNQGIMGIANQKNQNAISLQELLAQQNLGINQINAGGFANQQAAKGNLIGNLAGGAATYAGAG